MRRCRRKNHAPRAATIADHAEIEATAAAIGRRAAIPMTGAMDRPDFQSACLH